MMAALFLLFALVIIFIWKKWSKEAIILTMVTLVLCAFMFLYHATSKLGILL